MVVIMWLVILLGIGKEVYDFFAGGVVDFWDIVATVIGGLVMYLILK